MKLYAPEYYKDFVCIADKCRHSCCVGWEIDVDGEAMEKYLSAGGEYAEEIRKSIEGEENPHFRLCEDERCPHLDSRGLCRIITKLGEEYLCSICREHPRFYNETSRGMEVGLGMACEEAARLILSSDGYSRLVQVGEIEGEAQGELFDSLSVRDEIFALLSDRRVAYKERLEKIGILAGVSLDSVTDEDRKRALSSLEYLCEDHRKAFLSCTFGCEAEEGREAERERALAYFVYRHVTAAESEEDVRCAVGFCLFCEGLLGGLIRDGFPAAEAARMISEEIEYSEDNTETLKLEFLF